ncbi:hypothetical protein BC940DRAFT_294495 [Gongronella butleri]|nr:hypothetical protein BC940DRAFT_294495 [Gongronella butleri]
MAQSKTHEELQLHIDQLWKIIEQRDTTIQDLKRLNQKITKERDELAGKLYQKNGPDQLDDATVSSPTRDSVQFTPHPAVPTKSPYRNTSEIDLHDSPIEPSSESPSTPHSTPQSPLAIATAHAAASKHANATSYSPPPSPTLSQVPISPKIVQNDAKLFAQYQSAVLKRDLENRRVYQQQRQPPQPIPSKSSTLPTKQDRMQALQHRKQHNSMVFSANTVIPVYNDDKAHEAHPLDATPLSQDKPHTLSSTDGISIKVIGSMLRSNAKGKDVVAFVLSIGRIASNKQHQELWRIEKLYSDFLDLDMQIRAQVGKATMNKITRLPEKQLFATRSPNKLDQRKLALQQYLQHVITLPIDDVSLMCTFLSTDIAQPLAEEGCQEGYLTKRGKNFGGWKTRYFILKRNRLEYFETKDGHKLGTILLEGAQIGRQNTSNAGTDDNEHAYRHAFLIMETRKTSLGSHVRHILCASSDVERDRWISALMQCIYGQSETGSAASHESSTLRRSTSTKENMSYKRNHSQSSAVSSNRKLSKDDIRTVSATPISHLMMDNSQQVDLEKLATHDQLQDHNDDKKPTVSPTIQTTHQNPKPQTQKQVAPPLGQDDEPPAPEMLSPTLMSPVSSHDSPLTPRPSYQPALHPSFDADVAFNDKMENASNGTWRPESPSPSMPPATPVSPTPGMDRRGSDDHEKRKKNRMTLWGKKVFGTQSRSPGNHDAAPPGNTAVTNESSTSLLNGDTLVNDSPSSSPIPTDVASSLHRSGTKTIRNILSRQTNHQQPKSSEKLMDENTNATKRVFGVPLQDAVNVSKIAHDYELPALVYRCIEYLDAKNAVLEEGLYRLSGSNSQLNNLKTRFNRKGDVDLLKSKEEYDVHVIAGLLKLWLRELPVSVLTRELRPEFIQVIDLLERKDRVNELGRLVSLLPLANYTLLRVLTAHLIKVVAHSDVNRMSMRNISIVFSPTLGIPGSIFNLFLSEFGYIFWTDANGDAAPRQMEGEPSDDQPEPIDVARDTKQGDNAAKGVAPETDAPQPIMSKPMLRAMQDRNGRSNRNSMFFMDSAPTAIVDLEKQADGTHLDDDEEEVNELSLEHIANNDEMVLAAS